MPQSAVSRSYVTYEYYQNDYGGTTITADRFQVCTAWASRLVDRITFGRVAKLSDAECPDLSGMLFALPLIFIHLEWMPPKELSNPKAMMAIP